MPTERAEVGLRRKSWEAQARVAVPHLWLGPLPAPLLCGKAPGEEPGVGFELEQHPHPREQIQDF